MSVWLNHQKFLIRQLLSIQIERDICVKASKHAKNMFLTKNTFFTQISERSTCTHLHHSDLDSRGQRYLEMTKKILFIRQNHVLVEFFQTISKQIEE